MIVTESACLLCSLYTVYLVCAGRFYSYISKLKHKILESRANPTTELRRKLLVRGVRLLNERHLKLGLEHLATAIAARYTPSRFMDFFSRTLHPKYYLYMLYVMDDTERTIRNEDDYARSAKIVLYNPFLQLLQ